MTTQAYDEELPELSPGAEIDEGLIREIHSLAKDPQKLWALTRRLRALSTSRQFDAARWLAQGVILDDLDRYLASNPRGTP